MRPFYRFAIVFFAALIAPLAVWSALHFRSNGTATDSTVVEPAPHATETEKMVARLAAIACTIRPENGFNNDEKLAQMHAALGQPLLPAQESLIRQQLARELLISGKTEN